LTLYSTEYSSYLTTGGEGWADARLTVLATGISAERSSSSVIEKSSPVSAVETPLLPLYRIQATYSL